MQAEFAPPRTLHHLALAIPAEDFEQARMNLVARGFTLRTGSIRSCRRGRCTSMIRMEMKSS